MVDINETTLEPLANTLELHSDLSAEDRQTLLALPHRMRVFDASSPLVTEGQRSTHCAVMLSGFSYRQKQTWGGARQIVSSPIPGEALDCQQLFLDTADHSVQMLTRGEAALIAMSDLRELVDGRPGLSRAITLRIPVEASIFREWVLNVGRRDARSRLAHLLCEFAIRMRAGLAGIRAMNFPSSRNSSPTPSA